MVDCDVIQADGGTRTASITGGFIALMDACSYLVDKKKISEIPVLNFVAAVSTGLVKGQEMLDLCYEEDSNAIVDMNVVMTDAGELIEVQATGELAPFSRQSMNTMLDLAESGIRELISVQKNALLERYK